ncbi:MAG: glutamine--fructose-6-phosphate transaminase (isomerizing), partial [Campylobacterales bacterium]
MCGIVGYIGDKNIKKILLGGLKELEYRGYDSAGIAVMQNGRISAFKAVGKLINLEHKTADYEPKGFAAGIAHTRWATHGKPTEINAHPHQGRHSHVVHNGIIENYVELKERLQKEGAAFLSQTDTEAIVHLYESNAAKLKDPYRAFEATVGELEGAYAILLIDENPPKT